MLSHQLYNYRRDTSELSKNFGMIYQMILDIVSLLLTGLQITLPLL